MGGAERLLGRGDMLYLPIDAPKPVRSQGALITNDESTARRVLERQARPDERPTMEITPIREDDDAQRRRTQNRRLWYDAAKFLLDARVRKATDAVDRRAAGALLDRSSARGARDAQLEEFGVVGPNEGTKPRNVIIESPADIERLADRIGRPAQTDLFAG